MGIDDPVDAVEKTWPEPRSGPVEAVRVAILGAVPLIGPLAAALSGPLQELFGFFEKENQLKRLATLFDAANSKIDLNDQRIASLEREILRRADTDEFQAAINEAGIFALHSGDAAQIARMGGALGVAVASQDWSSVAPELRSFVHALAELTAEDIACLRIIDRVFASVVRTNPNLNNENAFTEKMDELRTAVNRSRIHPDDFYSTCRRLEGRGLVMEALRNTSRMGLDEHCFRPTLRGLRLLSLLDPPAAPGS